MTHVLPYLQNDSYADYSQEKMVPWYPIKDVQFFWFTRIELIKHLFENMKNVKSFFSISVMVHIHARCYQHNNIPLFRYKKNIHSHSERVQKNKREYTYWKRVTWHKTNVLNISVFFTLLECSRVSWVKCKRLRPLKLRVRRIATWKTACVY